MNARMKEPETHLLPVETVNAVDVFKSREKLDDLLAKIRAEAATIVPDVTTEEGRKHIASVAYKVARSKTAIDEAGKAMVEGWKSQAKVVDAERKHARDTLDALKDEIRRPLDEWQAEEARKEQALIEEARQRREAEEAARLADIERREAALREAEERIEAERRAVSDREAAEAAARERAEREAKIAAEAEERARREAAEAVAAAERQAAAAEESARLAAEQSERNRIAAEKAAAEAQEKAVRDAEARAAAQAAAAEQARKDEEARQKAEQERREANRRHCSAINRKAAAAIATQAEVSEAAAQVIVTLIVQGKIPAVSIAY